MQKEAFDTPSASAVKSTVISGGGSFSGYFEQFIEGLDSQDNFWEWKKYRVTLKKLRACLGNEIHWKDLDKKAVTDFEKYLREKCGNKFNTVLKELRRFHRVIKQGVKEGVVKPDADPFLVYDAPKSKPAKRRKLTLEEIRAIEALELEAGSSLRISRDAFIVSFYGGGVRFGDICQLKREHIKAGRLEYRMMKTGSMVSIPLPEPALQIIQIYANEKNAYLFPFLNDGDESGSVKLRRRISSRNVVVNRDLKTLARMAGIDSEGFSFHVSRHSFADYARRQSGDLYAVSKSLGHTSLQVTQNYLRSFDRDAVDKLAVQLWKSNSG